MSHTFSSKKTDRPYLGFYLLASKRTDSAYYTILAGSRDELRADFSNTVMKFAPEDAVPNRRMLVSLKRVPEVWSDEIAAHLAKHDGPRLWGVGIIGYGFSDFNHKDDSNKAYEDHYYPRRYLGKDIATGIPYFIEATVTSNLKRLGIDKMALGIRCNDKRTRQLQRIGVQGSENLPIKELLKGLGRGMKYSRMGRNSGIEHQ